MSDDYKKGYSDAIAKVLGVIRETPLSYYPEHDPFEQTEQVSKPREARDVVDDIIDRIR